MRGGAPPVPARGKTGPLILPVFLPFQGCPHRCAFCNARVIAGDAAAVASQEDLEAWISSCRQTRRDPLRPIQVAFYGGNFTGLDQAARERLFSWTRPALQAGRIHSLRISTRPDHVTAEGAEELRQAGVRTVELGAQSMVDEVLAAAQRGHTAADTARALEILTRAGLETAVHLMAGLPEDTTEGFRFSVRRIALLAPDMVRIHPTLVFRDTPLARLWREGRYLPLTLHEAVFLCREALQVFRRARIRVSRLGLQTTGAMERGAVLAGPHHPAFRSLVEESLFLEAAAGLLARAARSGGKAVLRCAQREESFLRGARNGNLRRLQERFRLDEVRVLPDAAVPRGTLVLEEGDGQIQTDVYGDAAPRAS